LPANRFLRAEYKNLTPLALGMLWAILRHEKWDVSHHRLEHVFHTEDGESWLERFPDEFVFRISVLGETTASQAADAWARSDEVRSSSDELKPVLRDLKRHSGPEEWPKLVPMGIVVSGRYRCPRARQNVAARNCMGRSGSRYMER
jgi:hypothetical protein